MLAMQRGCTRLVDVEHRRAGKDLKWLGLTIRAAAQRPGLYVHVLPKYKQAKKDVWSAMDGQGVPFLHRFPGIQYAGDPARTIVRRVNETEMLIELFPFPGHATGSVWQLLNAEDPDTHRGMNAVGIVFSEYADYESAKIWEEIFDPMVTENGGWVAWLFTPKGKNHGWEIYRHADARMRAGDPRWFCQLSTVDDTRRDAPGEPGGPVVSLEEIDEKRLRGVPEEIIQQEYYCSFDGFLRGTIYGDMLRRAQADGRICRVPHEVNLPVGLMLDLGRRDATAIWFYQQLGREIRFIDYHEQTGQGADYFAAFLKNQKPYVYGRMILPHDATQQDFSTVQTAADYFETMGFPEVTIAPKFPIETGIDMVRRMFPRCIFDSVKCARGLECLGNYRRAWNDEREDYGGEPIHDQYSHGADAFRTGFQGWIEGLEQYDAARPTTALLAFDPYTNRPYAPTLGR